MFARPLAAALLLCGCGAMPVDWEATPSYPPLPSRWLSLGVEGVMQVCGRQFIACAYRDHKRGVCWIVADAPKDRQPEYVIEHEEKHCAGYDHA